MELDYPNKKGETLRNHLLNVLRQSTAAGKPYKDTRLEQSTEPPNDGRLIWDAFWAINTRRGGTGYGPAPISWTDLMSYCQLYKYQFDTWEIDALGAMEKVYLEEIYKKLSEEEE